MHQLPTTLYRQWLDAKGRGLTQEQHAAELRLDYSVYLSRLETGRREIELRLSQPTVPGAPLEIIGDAVVVGDVHVPYTDYGMAQLVSKVGKRHLKRPRQLIIAGDLFNMDTWSKWLPVVSPIPWHDERDATQALIKDWLQVYDKIYFTQGNHDRRLVKFVSAAFDETDVIALINSTDKLVGSNYGHCTLTSGGITYRITHPAGYSVNAGVYVGELAIKHQQNVIGFHEHHLSKGWDRYGRYVTVNGGCLVDPDRLAYVRLDDNKAAGMKQGFVLVKNGIAHPLGREPYTDWREWV